MRGCLIVTVATGYQQHEPAEHKSPGSLGQKKPPRVLLYHLPAQPRPDINPGCTTGTGACFKIHCIGAVLVIQRVACRATFQSTCLTLTTLSKDFPWSPCLGRHSQFTTASIFLLQCPVVPTAVLLPNKSRFLRLQLEFLCVFLDWQPGGQHMPTRWGHGFSAQDSAGPHSVHCLPWRFMVKQ